MKRITFDETGLAEYLDRNEIEKLLVPTSLVLIITETQETKQNVQYRPKTCDPI